MCARPRTRGHTPALLLVLACAMACSEDDPSSGEASCYALDPELPIIPPSVPHCNWQPGEFPAPPKGYAKTNRVSVEFLPSDDEPCDPCNVELFDALLKTEIERECNEPYTAFVRGCFLPPDGTAGLGKLCQVRGLYASDCTPMN